MATIQRTITVTAQPAEIWALVRDFGAVGAWVPGVPPLELRGGASDAVGTQRVSGAGTDQEVVEQLVIQDETELRSEYTIASSPLPIRDYRAAISVVPSGSGNALVDWTATYEPLDDEIVATLDGAFGGAFQAGLDALGDRFGRA
jgi:carbon monoxide dehydrogenase subunit G